MEKNQEIRKEVSEDFRHIVRVANTDLNGNKNVASGLRKIHGVGFMFINAICTITGIDPYAQIGKLSDAELKKIDEIIRDPGRFGIPTWMLNRRKDYETGLDLHLTGNDMKYVQDNDVKRQRMIKAYRGVRSAFGLTVRGQRTRSNFRKNKGKVVGVIKSKIGKAAAAASSDKKKD
jgi:small subunit ribosomal protein S13